MPMPTEVTIAVHDIVNGDTREELTAICYRMARTWNIINSVVFLCEAYHNVGALIRYFELHPHARMYVQELLNDMNRYREAQRRILHGDNRLVTHFLIEFGLTMKLNVPSEIFGVKSDVEANTEVALQELKVREAEEARNLPDGTAD